MGDDMNEYLTLDELKSGVVITKNETQVFCKDEAIATLENVKDRLGEGAQRNVMEKIIESAKNNTAEVPKVVNLVEPPEIPKASETEEKKENAPAQLADVDIIENRSRFVRKKIDFNALDNLYLEEALRFVQCYRDAHSVEVEVPRRLEESYVEEILSTPITNNEKRDVVCAVPYMEIPTLGLPTDKVLGAMKEEIEEDILFSFITMNPYDSEKGDFVYSEEMLGAVNSEYPILM